MRLLLVMLLLLPALAVAGTGRLTWTMPTEDEDGQPVLASEIVSTTVEYSRCGPDDVFGPKLGELTVMSPQTSGNIVVSKAGLYCFRAYVSTVDEKSNYSNTVAKELAGKKPKAPVLLNVIIVAI